MPKVFDDIRNKTYILLEAIEDKEELVNKYTAAIKCLATVDKMLKMENDNMSDEQVENITKACEMWPKYMA